MAVSAMARRASERYEFVDSMHMNVVDRDLDVVKRSGKVSRPRNHRSTEQADRLHGTIVR